MFACKHATCEIHMYSECTMIADEMTDRPKGMDNFLYNNNIFRLLERTPVSKEYVLYSLPPQLIIQIKARIMGPPVNIYSIITSPEFPQRRRGRPRGPRRTRGRRRGGSPVSRACRAPRRGPSDPRSTARYLHSAAQRKYLLHHWNCNFPMNICCLPVGWLVSHNFLKRLLRGTIISLLRSFGNRCECL